MANQTIDTLSIKISATSSSAVKNLQNTAKAVKNVGNASNGAIPKMKKLNGGVLGLARSFGKFYASCFLLIRGIKALGRAIGKSMDYIETFNYFSVTLDKVSKESKSNFQEWGYESAEEYAESFTSRLNELTEKMTGFSVGENGMLTQSPLFAGLGIDPNKLINFQAQIMQLTNSVGELGETSLNTTKALSMLASDLSSFTNRDLSQVMTNLQSGLIGQSRALYKYGIDLTQASLEQEALAQGISKSVSEMSQQEKMQLRLLVILKNSRVAWGDQANTINSVANQYRMLKEQASNLSRIIGNVLMPVVQVILPYINALVLSLQKFFSMIGSAIYGSDWDKIMDGISGGVGDIDNGIGELDDSLLDADGSAKKLKKTLLGIDELNVLNTDNNSGSGLIGGGIDLSKQIADAVSDYETIWNKALQEARIKAVNIARVFEISFSNAFKHIKDGFNKAFSGENLADLKTNIDRISDSISRVFNSTEVSKAMFNFKRNTEETIGAIVGGVAEVGTNIADGVTGGVASAGESLEDFNKTKIASFLDNLSSIEDKIKKIVEAFTDFSDQFSSQEFKDFVENISKIVDLLSVSFIENVSGLLSDIAGFFASSIIENFKALKDLLNNTVELLNTILEPVGDLVDLIASVDKKYEDSFLHKFFQEISGKDKFVGWYNGFDMLTASIKACSWAIDVLNDAIEDLIFFWNNSGLKDIWNEFTNSIFNPNTNDVQYFRSLGIKGYASGGFPEDGWFRASHGEMIGKFDNGQSVVANNQQIVDGIKQGVYEAVTSAMAGNRSSQNVVVEIDGREVFKAVQRESGIYSQRTGKSAFAY